MNTNLHNTSIILLAFASIFMFASCNYTKHLGAHQTLLGENTLKLKTLKPIKYKGETESAILSLAQPPANTHMFDLSFLPKFKLWKYNNKYLKYQKDSMNQKIQKHKVEKPTLLDTFSVQRSVNSMKQFMENDGYFYAQVSDTIIVKNAKTSNVEYRINAGKNYTINNVTLESTSSNLARLIDENKDKTFLKKGDVFNYFNCGFERDRLYKIIKNEGFYDFKSDNISFLIDTVNKQKIKSLLDDPFAQASNFNSTNVENKTVDVKIIVDKTRDTAYQVQYSIDSIIVKINDDISDKNKNLIENELENIYFKYKTLPVNRKVITRNIFMQPGDIYNTNDFEITINRLNQLGIFKFVNIQFIKAKDRVGKLNCIIQLSTSDKMDFVGNYDVSTSDGDYIIGTGAGLTYRNKNLFFGANQLSIRGTLSTEFRYDTLLTGTKDFYLSGFSSSIGANLIFPKFVLPFQQLFSKKNMPYTILGASYNYIQRIKNYTLITISGNFGYTWQETQQKNWRVNPIFITSTLVPEKLLSQDFKDKMQGNNYIKNTFTNSIIEGENIVFEYKSKPKFQFSNYATLKIGLEEAGTLLKGINTVYSSLTQQEIKPIAHYTKAEIDLRKYNNRYKSQWVNRIMLGIGIPMGGSTSLPYIKQFAAGGAFSNRGWRARSLGPGHSNDSTFNASAGIIDRTGDLKFETNSEYRFNLLKLFSGAINLKGAAFVDAGNIWLMHKDKSVEGGEFQTSYIWQDIGITSGLGARLDFSFFVFRVDYGYPIKQPQVFTNGGFTIDHLSLKKGAWNIALGYPF